MSGAERTTAGCVKRRRWPVGHGLGSSESNVMSRSAPGTDAARDAGGRADTPPGRDAAAEITRHVQNSSDGRRSRVRTTDQESSRRLWALCLARSPDPLHCAPRMDRGRPSVLRPPLLTQISVHRAEWITFLTGICRFLKSMNHRSGHHGHDRSLSIATVRQSARTYQRPFVVPDRETSYDTPHQERSGLGSAPKRAVTTGSPCRRVPREDGRDVEIG